MGSYSQEDRAFRVDTPLGEDELLLEGFSGEERISAPFRYTLELLSENDAIVADDVLEQPVTVSVRLADGSDRCFHGIASRFLQLEKDEDLTSYRAEVVPWLWFLSLSRDCRVFQNMTALDIVEAVFGDYPEADYKVSCVTGYPEREYCVQYRESDLDFVSRLLEEEGIAYFFDHSEEGHTLTLVDDPGMIEPCAVQSEYRVATSPDSWIEEDVITDLEREHAVHTRKVTLRDYDYLQPKNDLETTRGPNSGGELYDYPGGYDELSDGDHYASRLLEERTAEHEVLRGKSTCRTLATGHSFDLKDYYVDSANQSYLVVRARHSGWGGGYRSGEPETKYENDFECIPASVPYRPPRRIPKPVIHGTQSAVVVGPSGEEIHTDDHARVKVQFHWDREGRRDQNSSCWVRVATPWAGKGYGSVSVPRIGNEVLVDFLEGDPDRPIVVGSVYNADQTPPTGGIEMGMKSRSSKGGGGYNQITLDDTKGEELITVHGQYDMNTTIEHDRIESVGNDETVSVGNDRTEEVGNDETVTVGNNETLDVGNSRKRKVGKNETITVTMNRSKSVGVNESQNIGAAQEVTVGGVRAVTVGAEQKTEVAADMTVSVGGNRATEVGDSDALTVGKGLVIDAGDEITIKTGDASISMKKDGTIQISGKDITVKGSGKIDVKASKNITMKGKKILQN